ncbi:hypothetical protein AGABI2DRAFT_121219 [Agaricus bisporus var. bisporus H97]|uniref:hypothetical protein n=1 Tax=Agaricus bisporus var. bisporus (strain H97 / ATCC MYA-4626 / FGSC 10389) TaxID=936046 RepID=UPI00029F6C9B|nr:hypothetical protein AGABI2DRAFT_121219 [Agaricus bisporus var. bisporus H97]EKV44026.1 hypothetical protein AGABI2DRAFT_121219 [Agaricus bisporus var. bisporus H97]
MQAFHNARNFVLSNPVFSHQSNHYQSGLNGGFHPEFRTKSDHFTQGIDILRESSAPEAAFDSDSRRYAPSCFPGTRSQYIEDIVNWATTQSAFPIYRMTGPAGVGKSAIAHTCAEELRSQRQLGASFFFTTQGCNDFSRFFISISCQLSSKSPDYHEFLDKKLRLDPTIVRKQLRSQFRELIVEPLRELELAGKQIEKKVILVDGLDECKDREAQREIIEIVITSISDRSTPFYWAFFSRPEPQIEAAFADHRVASLCISTFLPISRGIDGEIELYLRCGLQNILRRRGITTSDRPWPSKQDIHTLVSAAQGLYIYAATVLRFVGRTDTQYDPQELLHIVLTASTQCSYGGSMRTPFEDLDAFYTLILQRVPDALLSSIQLMLSFMVADDTGDDVQVGIRRLGNVLQLTESKMTMLCGELAAVVYRTKPCGISVTDHDSSSFNATSGPHSASPAQRFPKAVLAREEWLRFYHKSFLDFIRDPTRSGPFCVTTPNMRNKLYHHLVELQIYYSKCYSFQSNCGLTLAAIKPNVSIADTQYALSWPFDSEPLNSCMRAIVFEGTGVILLDRLFPYENVDNQLLSKFALVDHRTHLSIQSSWLVSPNVLTSGSIFGLSCIIKNVRGTTLCSATRHDMLTYDAERFRKGVSRLEAALVIQRYQPNSTVLGLPLFRCDPNENLLSGLYVKGRGQMSTFWYWILDPEMRYYRAFETVDLEEGEKIFQEENFELWDVDLVDDDWGSSGSTFPDEIEVNDRTVSWYSAESLSFSTKIT